MTAEFQRRLSDQFQLEELRLVRSHAEAFQRSADDSGADNDSDVSLQVGFGKPEQSGRTLSFRLRFQIEIPEAPVLGARVSADYMVSLLQDEERKLSEPELVHLGTTLLPEAVYPYYRALVTRLTSEMGLSPTTLGFIKTGGEPPDVVVRDEGGEPEASIAHG